MHVHVSVLPTFEVIVDLPTFGVSSDTYFAGVIKARSVLL